MSDSRILPRLIIILVCALIGAAAGTALQALRITSRPQEFRSLAKLVAGGQMVFNDSSTWRKQRQDFYNTIIETVESSEMKRRALERVRALNPDLQESEVDIRVTRLKDSAILTIMASGKEPKFTRVLLDALLDEYMAWRHEMRSRAQGSPNQDEDVAIMERASAACEHVESWAMPVVVGVLGGGFLGGLLGLLFSSILVRPAPPQSA